MEDLITTSRPYTSEDALNNLIKTMKADTNLISDGFHSFGELYEKIAVLEGKIRSLSNE